MYPGNCRGWCLQTVSTANCTIRSFLWNWNLEREHIHKFMILSNFAHPTIYNVFQSVICRLLDLSFVYRKAGIQTSAHPLETLRSWNGKKKLKIAVLETLSLLSIFKEALQVVLLREAVWLLSAPSLCLLLPSCQGTDPCRIWCTGAVSQRRKLSQVKSWENFHKI